MIEIVQLSEINEEIVDAFRRLIPQLSTAEPPDYSKLEEILHSPAVTILLARDPSQEGHILGTLTLVTFRTPTNMHAWIEDVVVDSIARNQGIGEALTRAGIELAAQAGAKFIDLTSRPYRQAANHLYQRIGFQMRETNVYRYQIEDEA